MDHCLGDNPRSECKNLKLLDEDEARRYASSAQALSDPIRIQMVHLLGQTKNICTCEFEKLLGLSQSKVSYHAKKLLDAGIVTRQLFGTWSHYVLADRTIFDRIKGL